MKTLHQAIYKEEITNRLDRLSKDSKRKWGHMSANEMLCHSADQLRLALGEKSGENVSSWIFRGPGKWLVFRLGFFPKNSRTMTEMNVKKKGTQPTEFETDLATLKDMINKFIAASDFSAHPLFGKMNEKNWSRCAYIHLDHHLKQFGL